MSLKSFIISSLLLLVLSFYAKPLSAQTEKDSISQNNIAEYQLQASQLVNYLEFTLNKIGSSQSTAREKDILINESFSKIFADSLVQIEDDLDENRSVPTNKNVQAYLKDIDFFFDHVEIKFEIEEVTYQIADSNYLYFKFQVNRKLQGILINGDSINNNKLRFIEINFDEENQDLKIASIYTTKLNEKEELQNWWNLMSAEWKNVFASDDLMNDSMFVTDVISFNDSSFVFLNDSMEYKSLIDTFMVFEEDTMFVQEYDTINRTFIDTLQFDSRRFYSQIRTYINKTELIIADTSGISNLDPISKLTQLQYLDFSGNLIQDLFPLRNLMNLEVLNCANTQVNSLYSLRYANKLQVLNANNTNISDLSILSNFNLLERLNLNFTAIIDLNDLVGLENLIDLRFTNTRVSDIAVLSSVSNLEYLNISSTIINNITPLDSLQKLRILVMDNSLVSDLNPLKDLESIKVVYADKSRVSAQEANSLMRQNPDCLVIFESEELAEWWSKMPSAWKTVFMKYRDLDPRPTKEQLHELMKIKIINVQGRDQIRNLDPLKKLIYLEHLDCSNTSIFNISPLQYLVDLTYLDCSNTRIANIEAIKDLTKLEYLFLSNTNISDLRPLSRMGYLKELNINSTRVSQIQSIADLRNLKSIFADNTRISIAESREFSSENKSTLLIFQTDKLKVWWNSISLEWQSALKNSLEINDAELNSVQYHQIAEIESLDLMGKSNLVDLRPLRNLFYLRELRLSGTQINDLNALANLKELELIDCADNPITDLTAIMGLPNLKYLDISNIPIKNFEQIQFMTRLETLICPGIQVKNLKLVEKLRNLKHLEIYNTGIKNLNPLFGLSLQHLKCYNTNINQKRIDKFTAEHPECEVVYY